jgi:hypothetical protein
MVDDIEMVVIIMTLLYVYIFVKLFTLSIFF